MKWFKFIVVSILIYVVIWSIFMFGYGHFVLIDQIVPFPNVEIEEWLNNYYGAGLVSVLIAFLCSCFWFYLGLRYSGDAGIGMKHTLLWLVTLIVGFICAFFIKMPSREGEGLALIFVILVGPLGFYMNSLFNYASAVKYIPPFADKLHR